MSITDELREWDRVYLSPRQAAEIDAIADRINETHAKSLDEIDEYWRDVIDSQHALIDESKGDYVELPKDKNGKHIHPKDTVRWNEIEPPRVVGDMTISCWSGKWSAHMMSPFDNHKNIWLDDRVEIVEYDPQEELNHDVQSLFDHNVDITPDIIRGLLSRQRELDGAVE